MKTGRKAGFHYFVIFDTAKVITLPNKKGFELLQSLSW